MIRRSDPLGPYLDDLAATYGPEFLHTDPLGEVRRFAAPADREVAGFLAAGVAFGRVDLILAHLREVWERIDGAPAAAARRPAAWRKRRLRGWNHRWIRDDDLAEVLGALGRVQRRHGSLGEAFLLDHAETAPDIGPALSAFVGRARSEVRVGGRRVDEPDLPYGVRTFFADPARGGACKRLNLFLRWMVRPDDGLDLGLWPGVRPAQLVIPVDTHVARLAHHLDLTRRATADWRMAAGITDRLRAYDPVDPVRYDFALARLGILDACPRKVDPAKCAACSLVPVCTLGRKERAVA
jgi:uncharacterized protein (TIGR02757 family)